MAAPPSSDGFRFAPLPAPVPATLRAAAGRIEPASLGHLLERGFTGPELRLIAGLQGADSGTIEGTVQGTTSGTVVTCRSFGDDSAIVHYAVSMLREGDFLVIDRAGGPALACFGGGLALAAHRAGCSGVLVNGPVTDVQELRALPLPVWATGLTALTTRRRFRQGEFCLPVQIGGERVEAGMLALGDENGVVFLSARDFSECLPRVQELQLAQQRRHELLRAGGRLAELNGTADAFRRIMEDTARRSPGDAA